ncbi:MAG: HAD family hydrolase [Anaerolineae bacterium]
MAFARVEAVLFDMDGTLIEHTWQRQQIAGALFAEFAGRLAPLTAEEFFDVFWSKNADMWYMMVDGVLDGDVGRLYSFRNTLRALGRGPALAGPMLGYWDQLILEEAIPFADTYEVLEALRPHYKTGIITNGYRTLQRAKIAKYRLADYVDITLVSEEAGCHKPDPCIFEQALALLDGVPPERAIFVGDTPETDIAGAQNAGLIPVWIAPRRQAGGPGDEVLKIGVLRELLEMLPAP